MPTPVLWGSAFTFGRAGGTNDPRAKVAGLKDGGFIAVWSARPLVPDQEDIRAQIYNADGSMRGAELTVNAAVEGGQELPSATILDDGRIAIAYVTPAGSDYNVRVRIISTNGELGSDTIVNTQVLSGVPTPSITAVKGGGFLVTFKGTGDGSGTAIIGQTFDKDLARIGAETVLNGTTASHQRNPVFATLSNGSFAMLYEDNSQSPDDSNGLTTIRGRVFLANGQPAPGTSEFLVPTSLDADQKGVSVTTLENGRFVAVWTHDGQSGDGDGSSIMAQIFNADGSRHGAEFRVNAMLAGGQSNPSVTALKDGGFAVAFYSGPQGLILAAFDASGHSTGGEIRIGDTPSVALSAFNVTTLADGRLMVQWEDNNQRSFMGQIVDARFSAVSLAGTAFNDHHIGTAYNDTFGGSAGADILNGGAGIDFVSFANATAGVTASLSGGSRGDAAGDAYTGIEGLIGSSFDDVFTGNGSAILRGGAGNDTYYVKAGDVVEEAANAVRDTLIVSSSYALRADAQIEVLAFDNISSIASADLTGSDIANEILGNAGANTLRGLGGNDVLKASSGNDRVYSDVGNDTIYGGAGNDKLYGGSGSGRDTFVFDTRTNKSTNVDRIYDFNPKYDTVWLDNAIFTKLGSGSAARPKKFSADMFVKSAKAQDREDRIVYDQKSGALYYDKDGTGSAAQVKIATLSKNLKLTYSDFFVI